MNEHLPVNSQKHSYGLQPSSPEFLASAKKLERHLRAGPVQTWQPGQTLDQDIYGACITFSGTQDLNATPLPHTFDSPYALKMYWDLKANIDHEPNVDDGSTHESLVKYLVQKGYMGGYAITQDMSIAQAYVDTQSPVLLGTLFYNSMEEPDANGIVAVDPSSGVAGGHSYLWLANISINGVIYCVCQNSWGYSWGVPFRGIPGGFFYAPLSDMARLVNLSGYDAGDVLAFIEQTPGTPPPPTPPPAPPSPLPDGCTWLAHGFSNMLKSKPKGQYEIEADALRAAMKVLLAKH